MSFQVLDEEELQKKFASYEKRLANSKEFFNLVADHFRCVYNDPLKAVKEGREYTMGMAKITQAAVIGYINSALKKIEKMTGEKQELIQLEEWESLGINSLIYGEDRIQADNEEGSRECVHSSGGSK